jgi:hypothetical protein
MNTEDRFEVQFLNQGTILKAFIRNDGKIQDGDWDTATDCMSSVNQGLS